MDPRFRSRSSFPTAAAVCLALYALAIWCEAAYGPGNIGFTERLTPARMIEALRVTGWNDIKSIELLGGGWLELVAVLGMACALLSVLIRRWLSESSAQVMIWSYTLLLLAAGSWLGLLMLMLDFLPSNVPPDGEFLDEGAARLSVIGIWTVVCVVTGWKCRPAEQSSAATS